MFWRRILTVSFFLSIFFGFAYKTYAQNKNKKVVPFLSEEKFILINGIEQWVTIKGNASKPAILFLHGGPGSPLSPFADNLYKSWEKDFTIIQWDQRGAGRTFGRNAPEELTPDYLNKNPLTIKQMAEDGIALSEYLIKHLGKKNIILFGTSWGSVLGITMAYMRPDLYSAYVAHSQVVMADDLHLYNSVYKLAKQNNDEASLKILDSLGTAPYNRARDVGRLLRIVKKYEKANAETAPDSWFVPLPEYDNEKDNHNREEGDDYSFVNYVGDKQLQVPAMRSSINFMNDKFEFKIPVFFIQGKNDLLTPKETTELYFNKIKAPSKEYFLLPTAAHGFNIAVVETSYNIFKSIGNKAK